MAAMMGRSQGRLRCRLCLRATCKASSQGTCAFCAPPPPASAPSATPSKSRQGIPSHPNLSYAAQSVVAGQRGIAESAVHVGDDGLSDAVRIWNLYGSGSGTDLELVRISNSQYPLSLN